MIQAGKYYNFSGHDNIEAYVLFVNKNLVLYIDKGANEDSTDVYMEKDELSTFEFYFEEEIERNWADNISIEDIKDE